MKNDDIKLGTIYFFIHMIIEVISFFIVCQYVNSNIVWLIALLYDFYAFIPQGVFGYLKDKGIKYDFAIIGGLLSLLSLFLLYLNVWSIIVVFSIALGNSLIHVEGAQSTLRNSNGKMSSVALFVGGGSFGVIIGKLLASYSTSILLMFLINILMLILIFVSRRFRKDLNNVELKEYNYSNNKINKKKIIILSVIVVIIRAYMGYGIPTSWNKTIIQSILLFSLMGTGKALGGLLIDNIGIRRTAVISTIFSLPFLLFGDKLMMVSLIGVMLFSMTMPVTLALIVSELKSKPGVAFGLTTIGLFLGSLPMFVFRINSLLINSLMVLLLTVFSFVILFIICRKEQN